MESVSLNKDRLPHEPMDGGGRIAPGGAIVEERGSRAARDGMFCVSLFSDTSFMSG